MTSSRRRRVRRSTSPILRPSRRSSVQLRPTPWLTWRPSRSPGMRGGPEAFRVNVSGTGVSGFGPPASRPPVVLVAKPSKGIPRRDRRTCRSARTRRFCRRRPGLSSWRRGRRDGTRLDHGLGLVVADRSTTSGPVSEPTSSCRPSQPHPRRPSRRGRSIRIGNADVQRDFTDVRDVVAYRLLLERWPPGPCRAARVVVNVASGRPVSIRSIADTLRRLAGCEAELAVDRHLSDRRSAGDRGERDALERAHRVDPEDRCRADARRHPGRPR
jgi:hypothetical protein